MSGQHPLLTALQTGQDNGHHFLVGTILDTVAPARRLPNVPLGLTHQVVEAIFQPGASVSLIARAHDVKATWYEIVDPVPA